MPLKQVQFINKMRMNQKFSHIHLIDSIYLGQLNSSFQKQGFGILQTFDFETYFGYFRNNKAGGLGLVILRNQLMIYANFTRDQIDGLTIIDDGVHLKCGIFRKGIMIGIGFEYQYETKIWKMQKFHKGIPIQTIKQEEADITNSLPKMINVEQSLFFHLYNYLQNNFFPEQDIQIAHIHPNNELMLCYQDQNQGYLGPGLKLCEKTIIQAGYYQNGLLNGFSYLHDFEQKKYQYGRMQKGKKTGIFIEEKKGQKKCYQYYKGNLIRVHQQVAEELHGMQKKLNFNNKTFFSAKNTFNFEKLREINIFNPLLKEIKNNRHRQQKKKLNVINDKNFTSKGKKKKQFENEYREKSSRQIMKEKIGIYMKGQGHKERHNKTSKKVEQIKNTDVVDEQIANEQNPFI